MPKVMGLLFVLKRNCDSSDIGPLIFFFQITNDSCSNFLAGRIFSRAESRLLCLVDDLRGAHSPSGPVDLIWWALSRRQILPSRFPAPTILIISGNLSKQHATVVKNNVTVGPPLLPINPQTLGLFRWVLLCNMKEHPHSQQRLGLISQSPPPTLTKLIWADICSLSAT